jgi:hypothetical protein
MLNIQIGITWRSDDDRSGCPEIHRFLDCYGDGGRGYSEVADTCIWPLAGLASSLMRGIAERLQRRDTVILQNAGFSD